jgi:hypothetical protein
MDEYEINFPAETLLGWIMEEHQAGGKLELWPAREYVEVPRKRTDKGSFTADEDLAETVTVGTLDVRQQGRKTGWILHFRVEDELAPHLPEDEDVQIEPEPIEIETFWSDFVSPGRGAAYAWITAESSTDKAAFERFVHTLEKRHQTKG